MANIAPVGTASLGAALWGHLDMAGEVWEWNLDWYDGYVDPCTDCAHLASESYRVIRGGGFLYAAALLSPSGRDAQPPTLRSSGIGFRCARAP